MLNSAMILKWTLLVSLSALLSFALGIDTIKASIQGIIGMFLGALSFIFIYIRFDYNLKEKGYKKWRQALMGAVIVSALLQFFVVIHLVVGAIAIDFIKRIFSIPMRLPLEDLNAFLIYSITITDAIMLSILVGGITLIIRLLMALWENYRTSV